MLTYFHDEIPEVWKELEAKKEMDAALEAKVTDGVKNFKAKFLSMKK